MKATAILCLAIDRDDMEQKEFNRHKETWKVIKKHLNDMKEGEDITFDQLLESLNVTG